MPRASHPLVHPDPAPVAAAPAPPAPAAQGQGPAPVPAPAAALQVQGNPNAGQNAPPGVLMRDFLGSPGTRSGLGLRLSQLVLSATALAVMVSTGDYSSVTSFRCVTRASPSPLPCSSPCLPTALQFLVPVQS
jgi:hypothetical protein